MQISESNLPDWISRNKRLMVVLLASVALVGVGVGLKRSQAERNLRAASAALYEAELKLEKELKLAGTTPVSDVDRQLSETVTALKGVLQKFAGQAAGWEAGFQLAELYFKYEPRSGKAIPAYQALTATAPGPREKLFTWYSLAYAFEQQGKFDEALQQLDQAIALGQPLLKAELALSRARLLARSGKQAEAQKAFEKVASDYANTEASRKAEQWKGMKNL
ncbi:MAG: tetratricopeptide repeat protein [Bdellovibrionales bacterium]|nr:tetratricopeptide repeat protein [Bdellovibrionales bacterium]